MASPFYVQIVDALSNSRNWSDFVKAWGFDIGRLIGKHPFPSFLASIF